MKSIGLVIDDVCSLPEEIIRQYQIEVVKIRLFFPEWEKNPEKNLYKVMAETRAYPKTSAPPPGSYLKAYKKVFENFEKVLVLTLGSSLSATYNSAREAKKLMPEPSKIVIFDTFSAVAPEGLLAIKAAQLIRENRNLEEILGTLKNLRERVKLFAFLKTTYWVEKIGRMTHWQGTAFKILNGLGVLPMMGIKKGKVDLTGFNFWTKDTVSALFHQVRHEAKKYKILVGINYTNNIELALKLKERIEKELKTEVVFVSLVPLIVGANSGPGTLLAGCLPVV